METRDLEYLLAVEREGGIGRAADALGITQPALTKAIQRIEAMVGMPLFERSSRGMAASAAGRVFLERARRIHLEYEDAVQEMHALRIGSMGGLRLGYSPSVSRAVLDACKRLLHDRPALQLQLRTRPGRELFDELQAGDFDLIVAAVPPEPMPGLESRELFNHQVRIVADAGHPLHERRLLTLADLQDEEWMLPPKRIWLRRRIEKAFQAQGLPLPRVRIETDFGTPSVVELVEGSRMLTGAIALGGANKLRELDLAPGQLELSRSVAAWHRSAAYVSPLALRLLDLLEQSLHP